MKLAKVAQKMKLARKNRSNKIGNKCNKNEILASITQKMKLTKMAIKSNWQKNNTQMKLSNNKQNEISKKNGKYGKNEFDKNYHIMV